MTDLSKLSYKELQQLEKQIDERKYELLKSKDCVEGYKITFCVKFNPAKHEYDDLNSPEQFGDYLVNDVTDFIIKDGFPDLIVSGFDIDVMTDDDKEEWKVFWESDDD